MKINIQRFSALHISEAESKARDKSEQVLLNLLKLTYFKSPENKNHWITELVNQLVCIKSPVKSGKFRYDWFIDPLTPIDEGMIDSYMEDLRLYYESLIPKKYDWNILKENLYNLKDEMNKLRDKGDKSKPILDRKLIAKVINSLNIL